MISERISVEIPPQMNILKMVIPILIHARSFISDLSVASRIMPHVIGDVINNVKLFPTIYRRIIQSQIFDVIQSEVALQKQVH